MRSLRVFLIILSTLLFWGCYSFSQTTLPGHLKTIVIYPAKNVTYQASMGDKLTQGIQEMFRKEAPSLRQINDNAQAEFEMTLRSYSNSAHKFDASGTVSEYVVTLVVDVAFRDMTKNEIIYSGSGLRGTGIYSLDANESEELHGQARALESIQQLIINNALSGW